jgi:hypothetical protein
VRAFSGGERRGIQEAFRSATACQRSVVVNRLSGGSRGVGRGASSPHDDHLGTFAVIAVGAPIVVLVVLKIALDLGLVFNAPAPAGWP